MNFQYDYEITNENLHLNENDIISLDSDNNNYPNWILLFRNGTKFKYLNQTY